MIDSRRHHIRFTVSAMLLLGVLAVLVWPLIRIQYRLSTNRPIATDLAVSLKVQFPGATFRGGASYESERIYITAVNGLNPGRRKEVELWLRRQKVDQKIAPTIWLRFSESTDDEDAIRI